MCRHGFIGGIGLGVLAGAAIGMAVVASPKNKGDMRRMARRATRQMERMKDDLTDAMGF